MLDISHIPSQQQNTTIFYATSGSTWQTWSKPRNAKMIEIFCLGGGGSGAQNGNNSTGPGGGGSAGITRGIIPAFLLPDTIYIQVGKGGIGPSTTGAGRPGGISYVGLQPSISEQTLICKSSTSTAGGGAQASSPGGGATQAVVSLSAFGNLGLFTSIAGVNGTAGGVSGGAGSSTTGLSTILVTGGCGGAGRGASFAVGGSIASASVILTSRVNGGQTSGASGDSGYGFLQPFCGMGGGGGASLPSPLTGTGGRGGDGWYGCGGGGAGGGTVLTKAGDGGDGLVIITTIT